MTTTTVAQRVSTASGNNSSTLTGTGLLLRLYLRRDQRILPVWVFYLGIIPVFYSVAFGHLYPTEQDRQKFAAASSGFASLEGPLFGTSLGAVTVWWSGIVYPLIALAAVLTVVRHTRAEEESGRFELVGATAIGRCAPLTAALALAVGGVAVSATITAVGLIAIGRPVTGSIAFGLAIFSAGTVFAAVAAVAAQLSRSARPARGIALGALGVAYGLRAVGDSGSGVLSWFSPLGWSQQLRPFAQERWWVLVLPAAATTALLVVAYALVRRRDLDAGLIAERPGPATAGRRFTGPTALAWRQHRAAMLAWSVGLGLFGLLIGNTAHAVTTQFGTNETVNEMIRRGGGGAALDQAYIAVSLGEFALFATAYAISAVLQLHSEEEATRAETLLSTATGRTRWAGGHVLFALLGPAVAMAVCGALTGLAYGLAIGDVAEGLRESLGGALVQVPAIWVITAAAMLLFGAVPRFATAAWVVLGFVVTLFIAGFFVGLPQSLLDLNPFAHLPKLPGGQFELAPIVWLLVVAAALLGGGLVAFRRRDLR
ncbi:ABC transporter permease [Rhodococcus sp. D2-41]|uniref:ABC transporter permease n=1 Tax=Speluncibacter jeojiensis TaxID=2710754 RepID=UPI00240F047C|nr:ABC transporter permease [Rhodococcus sp. D2-41]MDG3009778.1 ABC transporter permease [Rhodococcus sp. D2-41]